MSFSEDIKALNFLLRQPPLTATKEAQKRFVVITVVLMVVTDIVERDLGILNRNLSSFRLDNAEAN